MNLARATRKPWKFVLVVVLSFALARMANAQSTSFNIVTSPNPNPRGNTLNAVAALNTKEAWAAGFQNDNQLNGSRTLIERWNGIQWKVVPSPNPGSPPSCNGQNSGNMLNAIAEVSPSNAWAAGFKFDCRSLLSTMMLRWNGSTWNAAPLPALHMNDNSALNGLAALAANNIYAVGYQPAANGAVLTLIEHFNGVAWSLVQSPNANNTGNVLQAISADSPNDVWAVGDQVAPNIEVRTLIEHFDGKAWSVIPSPNVVGGSDLDQNVLTGVRATSPTDVTAIGFIFDAASQRELTLIEHWDGISWSVVPSPNQSTAFGAFNTLTSVTGLSSSDLYATGYFADSATGGQHTALIEHFDGTSWSIIPLPAKGLAQHLNGAAAVPNSRMLWAVGAFSVNGDDPETGLLQVPQTFVIDTVNG
jgi:hypothetical protein